MKIALDTGVLVASIKRIGEKYHQEVLQIADRVRNFKSNCVSSSLVLIELPGALASSTTMPIEKIYTAEASIQENFNLVILPLQYVDTAESFIQF